LDFAARGMAIFPYGNGNSTNIQVSSGGLPRGPQFRGRRSYQIPANGATISLQIYPSCYRHLLAVARMVCSFSSG
jgi:hypothetical protein